MKTFANKQRRFNARTGDILRAGGHISRLVHLIRKITFLGLSCALIGNGLAAQSANEIIKQMDRVEGYRSSVSTGSQIITTSSGAKRTLRMRSWSINNGRKQLAEYLSPSDIKGQKILMTAYGDNIWMFNPETRRTRKLGSHMRKRKVMGSDFTYEDQAGGRISKKYTGKILREEAQAKVDSYVLELRPTASGPSYKKVIAWVGKKDYVTRRIDFYRTEGRPFKRLILSDIRRVGSKLTPFRMVMTNLDDNTRTVSLISRIKYGVKIPGNKFQSRNLKR